MTSSCPWFLLVPAPYPHDVKKDTDGSRQTRVALHGDAAIRIAPVAVLREEAGWYQRIQTRRATKVALGREGVTDFLCPIQSLWSRKNIKAEATKREAESLSRCTQARVTAECSCAQPMLLEGDFPLAVPLPFVCHSAALRFRPSPSPRSSNRLPDSRAAKASPPLPPVPLRDHAALSPPASSLLAAAARRWHSCKMSRNCAFKRVASYLRKSGGAGRSKKGRTRGKQIVMVNVSSKTEMKRQGVRKKTIHVELGAAVGVHCVAPLRRVQTCVAVRCRAWRTTCVGLPRTPGPPHLRPPRYRCSCLRSSHAVARREGACAVGSRRPWHRGCR